MNQFELACAVLSAASYVEKRSRNHLIKLSSSVAQQLPFQLGCKLDSASGFEASAFEYGE